MHKLRSFFQLTTTQKILLFSALVCLPVCQLAVNLCSFSWLIRIFGLVPIEGQPITSTKQSNLDYVTDVAKMTRKAAYNIPFLKARCLTQALTLLLLAGSTRKKCVLNLGVDYDSAQKKLSAHAWVDYDGQPILGYEELHKFHHIASFN